MLACDGLWLPPLLVSSFGIPHTWQSFLSLLSFLTLTFSTPPCSTLSTCSTGCRFTPVPKCTANTCPPFSLDRTNFKPSTVLSDGNLKIGDTVKVECLDGYLFDDQVRYLTSQFPQNTVIS